jgi:hypothetical protein
MNSEIGGQKSEGSESCVFFLTAVHERGHFQLVDRDYCVDFVRTFQDDN